MIRSTSSSLKQLRERADKERDGRNWSQAAVLYGQYLEENRGDYGILVQHGNCLKEAGDYDGANASYLTAKGIRDDDADLFLQLGHLHKLSGKYGEALKYYDRSLTLRPEGNDAHHEIRFIMSRLQIAGSDDLAVSDVPTSLEELSAYLKGLPPETDVFMRYFSDFDSAAA